MKSKAAKNRFLSFTILLAFILCSKIFPYTDIEKKTVKIKSVPNNADLFINGENYGKTDAEIFLQPGVYKITLKKASYLSLSSDIKVDERGNEFSFQLTPMVGWMDLTVHPSDTRVVINDSAFTGFDEKLLGLSPGKNNILLEKEGYFSEKDSVHMIMSDRVIKVYNLTPVPEIQIQSESKKMELRYLNLVLNSWDINDPSVKFHDKNFVIKIHDDISVAPEYKGTPKLLFGNVKKNGMDISIDLDNRSKIFNDGKEIKDIVDYKCSIGAFNLNLRTSADNFSPELLSDTQSRTEYSIVLKPRSKFKSIIESALCPGLGQLNCKRTFTGISISAAFAASLIWNIYTVTDYYDLKKKLNNDVSSFLSENNVFMKYEKAQALDDIYAGIHVKRRKANITLGIIGAIYALNILDAIFMTPRVKEAELDHSNLTGLSFVQDVSSDTYFIPVININL